MFATTLRNVQAIMATQIGRGLVPEFEERFEEIVNDVATLEAF